MQLSQIVVTKQAVVRPSASEVTDIETALRIKLPQGYSDFVTTFGGGVVAGAVRVYLPAQIQKELAEWRDRIAQYWFWDKGLTTLTKTQALESVVFANTVGGDEFIIHPNSPNKIYALPRESEDIFVAGTDLWTMLTWVLCSGFLYPPFQDYTFEAFRSDA
jgi:hypothetical protein